MRAIVDARGLAEAVEYYRMFPHEPGRQREDDMDIDRVEGIQNITLSDVLDSLIRNAGQGETEVLIVAHGEPRGFLMPLAPRGVSAMKGALDTVMRVAAALERRDQITHQRGDEQLAAWTAFIDELAPGTIQGAITVPEALTWFNQRWLPAQGRAVRLQTAVLTGLVDKMRSVRRAALRRVEIRACNIGRDLDALRALRQFLGAGRVCAPNVGTFYVRVLPLVAAVEQTRLAWAHRYAGPATSPVYARGAGPQARAFDVYVGSPATFPQAFVIEQGMQLRVWEISRHPHRYAARATAREWGHVKHWVDQNILPHSAYQQGPFILAGMWTFGQGADPYATPMDPAYRNAIVCSP